MPVRLLDPKKHAYQIRFTFRGKTHKKVIRGSKRLAEEVEVKMRSQLSEGRFFPERALRQLTIDHIAARFLKEYACYMASADKIEIYVRGAVKFFNGKTMNEITPADVQRFRADLDLRMSPVSTNHYHRLLRRLFNWAADAGLYKGENPASGKKVKFENERKYWRRIYLEPEQFKALLAVADVRIQPILLAATLAGLRKGELENVRSRDVNLDSCTIFISAPKSGEPESVPITDTLFPVLERLVKQAPDAEAPIFNFTNYERLWKRARQAAGLSHIHLHDLRHTFGSHIVMKTGDLKVTQELLRHKDYRMTLRYAHLAPGHLRKAALTLDETFACLRPQAVEAAPAVEAPAVEPLVPNLVPSETAGPSGG